MYYFPYDQDTKIYQFMFLEDIPTTREDVRKKEKEWLGFERALSKIGLHKEEVLDRIKRGLTPYRNTEDQRHKCEKVYKEVIWTGRRKTVSPPKRIMTAAKSKTKRPDEQHKADDKQRPKEKATSSKPEKTRQEATKRKVKVAKPPMSNSPGPCAGECEEICHAGPKLEEGRLTCKVQEEHVSKDCRCKMHEKRSGKIQQNSKHPQIPL